MNLYEELGLSPDASDADIKAAHRRLAKECHPDKAGGDQARFQRVQIAYDTLKDKKKRKHYDRTGDTSGATPPDELMQAVGVIFEGMVAEMLGDNIPEDGQDLRQTIVNRMGEKIGEITKDLNGLERKIKKAGNMLKKWKRKKRARGPDMMGMTLRRQERDLKEQAGKLKQAIKAWSKAMALVNSYEYEFMPTHQPTATGWAQGGFIRIDMGSGTNR